MQYFWIWDNNFESDIVTTLETQIYIRMDAYVNISWTLIVEVGKLIFNVDKPTFKVYYSQLKFSSNNL